MVLLFDEFDAVAKSRDDQHDVGELKRVVNSLLQAMDTFVAKETILIGASNHQYMLDPAIWRRFDDVITFAKPSPATRASYISHQLNGVSFAGALPKLVKSTSGLSFAEIEQILVEAVKTMILADRKELLVEDLTEQLAYHKRMAAATTKEQPGQDE
jgi:SpoVK/Ycf46/Vps4 family AAA+-type ATPase